MGHVVNVFQFNHLVSQQTQGPALVAFWRSTAGERQQAGFLGTIEQPPVWAWSGAAMQGRVDALLNKAFTHTGDRGEADIEGVADRLVRPCWPPSAWSAFIRMRACVNVRAGAEPEVINVVSKARSSSVNVTRYFFAIVDLLLGALIDTPPSIPTNGQLFK